MFLNKIILKTGFIVELRVCICGFKTLVLLIRILKNLVIYAIFWSFPMYVLFIEI